MALLLVLSLVAAVQCTVVTFNNTAPRLDVNGNIVNGHDGPTVQFEKNGPFYYYGMEYALCHEPANMGCDQTADHCGFHPNHNISIWKSATLASGTWQYVGSVVQVSQRPAGIVYRPQVLFNKKTQLYVLWWNYASNMALGQLKGSYHGYAVATAPTPEGPFTVVNTQVNVTRLADGPGDYALYTDDDGAAYLTYSAAHWMSIERLTDDYVYSTGIQGTYGNNTAPGGTFPTYFVEAPVMFKRGDIYYVLFGHCCCYCYQGSGIMVWTAANPLGPWQPQGADVACHNTSDHLMSPSFPAMVAAEPTPGQGCLYNSSTQVSATRAQQNYVIQAPGSDGSTVFLWTGDRWQQSPDGLKGHDPQTVLELGFEADGSVQEVYWKDAFKVDLAV